MTRRRVPRWASAGSEALSLTGLAVSAYLTYEHFTAGTTLACPDTGAINCVKVTTSEYSDVAGIPVAVLGLLYFVAMTVLCLPALWHASVSWVHGARAAAAGAGVIFVLYLVWAELFRIDAICLWCTVVHAVTLVLFGVVILGQALLQPSARTR